MLFLGRANVPSISFTLFAATSFKLLGTFLCKPQQSAVTECGMKPPPDVVFHRAQRLMVWIPHGVMDEQRIEQLVDSLAHEEALAQTYFNRFSDFSNIERVDLNFDYVFNAALLRRLTHASGPKVKSALVVKTLEAMHYSKLYATLMEHSSLQVRPFNNREAAASWLGYPADLLTIPVAPQAATDADCARK
jgi:hypothetical protein